MKTIKCVLSLILIGLFINLQITEAKSGPKKYKNAPDEVYVIVVGKPDSSFVESQFPHLKFYYLPDMTFTQSGKKYIYKGSNDFLVRWGSQKHLASDEFILAILLDKNNVVAYERVYSKRIAGNIDNNDELNGTMITIDQKSPKKPSMADFLKDIVTKEELVKVNKKKVYTQGVEPDFKGWEDGDIEDMEFPDMNMETSNGKKVSLRSVTQGKPALIVFVPGFQDVSAKAENDLKSNKTKTMSGLNLAKTMLNAAHSGKHPIGMLWHIEAVFFGYYPPR